MHLAKMILIMPATNKLYQWAVIQCTELFEDMSEEYCVPDKTELVYDLSEHLFVKKYSCSSMTPNPPRWLCA